MRIEKRNLFSLFCALALVLGFFESCLPVLVVVPGGKVGLANIVTMVVFCLFSLPEALCFGILRSLLTAILFSGFSAFFYSAAGSVCSVLFMWIFRKILRENVSPVGLSVIGSVAFQIGQLTVAACVLETVHMFRYFPALGILAVIAGLITGAVSNMLLPYINRKKG